MTSYFISLYKISGVLYSALYIIIYKVIITFLVIILCLKYMKLFKNLIMYLKKERVDITKTVINSLIIIFAILFYDIFLLFFGDNLLNIFSFIIN